MLYIEEDHQKQPGEQEYRCTLPELYPTGHGKKDPEQRQGFYFYARDEEHAREKMRRAFPTAKKIDVALIPQRGAKA